MTTIKELYHQIKNIEAQAVRRDLTGDEFEQISLLQDRISDSDHPGYEMREWFETVDIVNDHLMFTVHCKESGKPVDSFKVYREGNRYQVRGQWKGHVETREWATQILSKWF